MVHSFVDTTAVCKQRTGTSTWILHLLDGLCRSSRIGKITAFGGDSAIVSAACEAAGAGDRFQHMSARSPHVALNFELAGNRKSISPDICFFPNYFIPFGWPAPSAATIHDVSFLTHPDFYSIKMRNWYRNRIKHTVLRSDVILTVSQASKTSIIKHLGINPDRIVVLPPLDASSISKHSSNKYYIGSYSSGSQHTNGNRLADKNIGIRPVIDNRTSPTLSTGNFPHDKPCFLYVGTIEPRKNLLNLLKGFKAAGLSDTNLLFIGRPNASFSYYRKFLKCVSQTSGAHYLGYRDDTEVDHYMSNCHGLIQLSWIEGFGIPLFQALASGIPTLISDDPAMCELAGGQALVSRPNDISMIANHLNTLQLRGGIRNPTAKAWCKNNWSREAWCRQLDEVIDRLSQPKTPTIPVLSNSNPDTKHAIIEGICYASVFNAPVHSEKLYYGLRKTRTTLGIFRTTLNGLLYNYPDLFRSAGPLVRLNSVCCGEKYNHTSVRKSENQSTEIRQQHQRFLRAAASLPWIRSIYFSGGTVHGTGLEERPDLDLFIVTRSNRVWLSYVIIRLASIISGKGQSVCCNYMVDESAMSIIWQREFYTAFQLLHLRQVVRKPGTPHMRAVNQWIYEIFPNAPRFSETPIRKTGNSPGFLYCLNILVMTVYEFKWSKKGRINGTGGVRFDAHRIKLHTNDHRPGVYAKFQNIFNRIMTAVQTKKQSPPVLNNDSLAIHSPTIHSTR